MAIHVRSGFGMRVHPVTGVKKMHNGIDIAAPTGTPVFSFCDGVVTRVDVAGVGSGKGNGNAIHIAVGPFNFQFFHLSRVDVRVGQKVHAGQVIGAVGSTGLSSGPHLHFGTLYNGKYVNPVALFPPGTFV